MLCIGIRHGSILIVKYLMIKKALKHEKRRYTLSARHRADASKVTTKQVLSRSDTVIILDNLNLNILYLLVYIEFYYPLS